MLLFALLAFVAQPASAASSPGLTSLEQQISGMLANKSADVGIYALDLTNGESVSYKGDVAFPMASTVKVAVAALYLAQVDHGRRSLDDTINGVSARTSDRSHDDPQRQPRDRHSDGRSRRATGRSIPGFASAE